MVLLISNIKYMEQNHKSKSISPKFFFLSLGALVTLIASVIASLNLFFDALTKKMPDVLNSDYTYGYSSYSYDSMRTELATLIIVFPIFLIISLFWWKYIKNGLEGWNKTIFKWMIYLILFLASVVIIVDLVALVNYFVSGEITGRFIYKVLGTAVIAGLIWASYYNALNVFKSGKLKKVLSNVYIAASIAFFIALIMFSFRVMGSPKEQRSLRLDERRVSDLQTIQWQVINYWQNKGRLPSSLTDLKDPISYSTLPLDPEFEKGYSYEYATTSKLSFELCATFGANMPKGWQENSGGNIMPMYNDKMVATSAAYPGGVNDSWDHGKGRTCFTRTIDPEIYRPIDAAKTVEATTVINH